jgi:MFS family permease
VLNEWLLALARWLDSQAWSTAIHESYYLYNWIETTHVLTLMVFLGMLAVIDLRMLGRAFTDVPADAIADRLDRPMMIGFIVMVVTGLLLFYAIPVRTTQSIWFRIKVALLIAAGVNALLFRNVLRRSAGEWSRDVLPPRRIRVGAGLSLSLWIGVIAAGRLIAYDWFDCDKPLSRFSLWAAGCVDELAAAELD